MLKVLRALVRWFVTCYLPTYVAVFLLLGFFMFLTTGWLVLSELWPLLAILTVPAAVIIAASQSLPVSERH
jgi:hypothetical protein